VPRRRGRPSGRGHHPDARRRADERAGPHRRPPRRVPRGRTGDPSPAPGPRARSERGAEPPVGPVPLPARPGPRLGGPGLTAPFRRWLRGAAAGALAGPRGGGTTRGRPTPPRPDRGGHPAPPALLRL